MESWKVEWELNNLDKIVAGDELTSSGQSNSEIIEALRAVSPEVFTDGKVDFELLQNALGGAVEDSEERYGMNWNGKRKAMLISRTPSFGTLRPSADDGLNSESSKNVIIGADNLFALKLFQKSYTGKVKGIFIDPPYNTGEDFVYDDQFADSIENYFKVTGQIDDEGKKLTTNTETSGRYHSNWLNMMYPRLKLARNLLRNDGLIFVSIDDKEVYHLRLIMNEIFGESNFVDTIIWKKRYGGGSKEKHLVSLHEYILVYAADIESLNIIEVPLTKESIKKYYKSKDESFSIRGGFRTHPLEATKSMGDRPNLVFEIEGPDGNPIMPKRQWLWSKGRVDEAISKGELAFLKNKDGDYSVHTKQYLKDENGVMRKGKQFSIIDDVFTQHGTNEIINIFGNAQVFSFPKPTLLLKKLIDILEPKQDDIIIDFFAGSGSMGHTVLNYNLNSVNSDLRYILIQLPELLDPKKSLQRVAVEFLDSIGKPRNIAEITKERMRRVAAKIKEENPDYEGDLGFKVFKLDSSNIKAWDGGTEDLQKSLEDYVNHIKDDRTSSDILYEMMLKSGIELTADIQTVEVGGNKVLSVDGCRLLTCLDDEIKSDAINDVASKMIELKKENTDVECTVLFLDKAFPDDSAKLNMSETLKQSGIDNIRSI
jgi:adenine-specific DNA-methyltransferase